MSSGSEQKTSLKGLIEDLLAAVKKSAKPSPRETGSLPKSQTQQSFGDPEDIAHRFGLPFYTDLSEFPLVKEKATLLPYTFAKSRLLLPLEEQGEVLLVAMTHPFD